MDDAEKKIEDAPAEKTAEFMEFWARQEEAAPSSPYLPGDWVRVKQAKDENAAIVEGILLRENGVSAEIGDEKGVPVEGGRDLPGLWIWVRAAHLEKAKWVLWQWHLRVNLPKPRTGCPKCGCDEVYRRQRFSGANWTLGLIFPPLLVIMLWEMIRPGNRCYRCGYQWRKKRRARGFPVIMKEPRGFPVIIEDDKER